MRDFSGKSKFNNEFYMKDVVSDSQKIWLVEQNLIREENTLRILKMKLYE